jgi:uncharacterized membrane protein
MTEPGMSAPQARRVVPRWLLAVLVSSLALNFIVVGSVAGAVWRYRSAAWGGHGITPNLLGYASTLPAERRKELWNRTAEERRHIRPFRREVRLARDETLKMLTAEPFDKPRFLAAQARLLDAENRARAAVQGLYAELAQHLTPEERRGFQHWREHRRPAGHNLLDESNHQANDPKQ